MDSVTTIPADVWRIPPLMIRFSPFHSNELYLPLTAGERKDNLALFSETPINIPSFAYPGFDCDTVKIPPIALFPVMFKEPVILKSEPSHLRARVSVGFTNDNLAAEPEPMNIPRNP